MLTDAGLEKAKMLISTLHIELTNDLLAFYCQSTDAACSVHAVDLTALDNLLQMDVDYLIVPKADGIKRQNQLLRELGYIET